VVTTVARRQSAGRRAAAERSAETVSPQGDKLNLVIIGGRGCGKSSICRRLQASDKRFKLMSLDDLIVYEADGASIPEIVEERGWTGFRDVEYLATKKAASLPAFSLIDAGGGVLVDLDGDGNEIYSERKAAALKASGLVVYIRRDVEYLTKRIAGDSNRPDLDASKSFAEIMQRREPYYLKAADLVIDASGGKTPMRKVEIGRKILTWYYEQTGIEPALSSWYNVFNFPK